MSKEEQNISIMIADDELSIRETIKDYLDELGYRVSTFSTGWKGTR